MALFTFAIFVVIFIAGLTNGSPAGKDSCTLCQNMIVSVNMMVDEETRNQILDTICEAYAIDGREKCLRLSQMSPTELCQKFGQCASSSLQYEPELDSDLSSEITDVEGFSITCLLCQNVMRIAHAFLSNKTHQRFLLHVLKSVCRFVPFLTKECQNIVNNYGSLVVNLAAQYLNPASCKLFHICPAIQVTTFKDECRLCRFGIGLVYDTVQDPALETRIQEFTEEICNEYAGKKAECVSMAEELTQHLLPVAEELRHSDFFKYACRRANICSDDVETDVMFD